MNKLIKDELDKIKNILPPYDENTLELYIPKKKENNSYLEEGVKAKIKIASYIINPYDSFTLADNWNNGTKPDDEILNVEVLQVMGKMIRVNSSGDSTKTVWSGWLPKGAIEILEIY